MVRYILVFFVFLTALPVAGQDADGALRSRLSEDDYAALVAARGDERRAADLLIRFYENYDMALAAREDYVGTQKVSAADSAMMRFEAARGRARDLAAELGMVWERIFDNKTFAYNYFLETRGHYDILGSMERAGRETRDLIARESEGHESEAVLRYLTQKGLVFEYERTLAGIAIDETALDSLAGAAEVFGLLRRPLPRLDIEERVFIVYDNIGVFSPARYNASKPIPKVAEYRVGRVYRVRLGTYSTRPAVSVFKGVWPLGWRQEGTRWSYYAGGYADLAAAEKALAEMKKRGFAGAVLALWDDGEMILLGTGDFRVEIEADSLSEGAKSAVAAAGRDMTLVGGRFVLGPFGAGLDAARAAAAIRAADPSLTVRITGI